MIQKLMQLSSASSRARSPAKIWHTSSAPRPSAHSWPPTSWPAARSLLSPPCGRRSPSRAQPDLRLRCRRARSRRAPLRRRRLASAEFRRTLSARCRSRRRRSPMPGITPALRSVSCSPPARRCGVERDREGHRLKFLGVVRANAATRFFSSRSSKTSGENGRGNLVPRSG